MLIKMVYSSKFLGVIIDNDDKPSWTRYISFISNSPQYWYIVKAPFLSAPFHFDFSQQHTYPSIYCNIVWARTSAIKLHSLMVI